MPYQKHYKLVDDVTSHFDAVTATIDGFTLSRYVGFFAVASAAVIESAYKDIVLDFAERTHPTFSSYFASRHEQIGRASCRERVCQYVWISVVALSLKKKSNNRHCTRKH